MKLLRVGVVLCFVLCVSIFTVRAVCDPADSGTAGDDTILCDLANQPAGDVEGQDGDDLIVITSDVSLPANGVSGGNAGGATESGNDVIVNDGVVGIVWGDSQTGVGSGNDVIVNNGTVNLDIIGDTDTAQGTGDDILVNNGNIAFDMIGDTNTGDGSGNDSLTNNGNVGGEIIGDTDSGNGSGNDTIVNNGTANGIYGDEQAGTGTGNDTITNNGTIVGDIIAGGGDDSVTINGNTSTVGGTINGGAGYDVLTFNLSTSDPAQLQEWAAQIASANPNGGTLTFNGHTYTWTNFEELSQILLTLAPINGYGSPFAVYCHFGGGIDVYSINGQQGTLALNVSAQMISNGIDQADNGNIAIGSSTVITIYVLTTGEVQVNAANGIAFTFLYDAYCGVLPEAQPNGINEGEEGYPALTIINQPYEDD